ncbi:alpha/beta hydrolase [Alphaproteobacteria bacterium]|nr:alpha/beta hydrolase [Alphaproteobacteria bacterium]
MITDWDDAYANGAYIPGAAEYPPKWAKAAAEFRQAMAEKGLADLDISYGEGERNKLDLFRPEGKEKGLAVFIHGGYWRVFDKSFWSHLAAGSIERGWAFALPSYDLAPTVRISEITQQMGAAITKAASLVDGPIHISGHSAGGHLVSRMMCQDSPLSDETRGRLKRIVSISGLHDMRPLLKTEMNDDFRMDEAEAIAESAVLNQPFLGAELVCWVGGDERLEFLRQSELLANMWTGFGTETFSRIAEGQHHFDVIDGLSDPQSALTKALLD